MKTKYRIKSTIQFFAFAFYPKTTLIVSTIISVIAITLLSWIMSVSEEDSSLYNIAFALITGAVASFFVAIIVELSNNYRHNKLAWYELQDYYQCITDYENMKQALMHPSSVQNAKEKARYNFTTEGESTVVESQDNEDKPKDSVEATWSQLPKIMPTLSNTFKTIHDIFKARADTDIINAALSVMKRSEVKLESVGVVAAHLTCAGVVGVHNRKHL